MKNINTVVLVVIVSLIGIVNSLADVTYLDLRKSNKYLLRDVICGVGHAEAGEVGANALNHWLKENPDKKIVSVAPHHRTHGGGSSDTELNGFWIVWELKSSK